MSRLYRMDVKTRLAIVLAVAFSCLIGLSIFALSNLREAEMQAHRTRIHHLTDLATAVVNNYVKLAQSGKLSTPEAQRQAIEAVRAMRFGNNDYFFIYNFDGQAQLVVGNPKLEGKNMLGKVDAKGYPLWDNIVRLGKEGGGYLEIYWFPRAGSDTPIPKLGYVAAIPEWQWSLGTGVYIDDVNEILMHHAINYAIAVVLALLLAGGIGLSVARSIVRQLGGEPTQLMAIMQRAAAGDLSTHFPVRGGTDSVLARLKEMLQGLGGLAQEVRQASADLEKSAKVVATTSSNVLKMASEQADGTSAMAAAMEEMTVAINHIADNARDTEADSSASAEQAGHGAEQAHKAVARIQELVQTAQGATDSVSGLVARANEIGTITSVIKEVAAQTNLLALNAAIEAARAGEQGRGFAVVADEVRGLAERTANATVEIEQMIQAIQEETRSAVDLLSHAVPQARDGAELTEATAELLQQLRANSNLTLTRVRDVADSTREQSQASTDIAQQVERIANVVQETRRAMDHAAQEVAHLEQLSQSLHQGVERFQI
ncbi:methyl-accepting chemotaxis protein [Paludibacterium purpuratum]|uniref:Methyl-accepting chemotaxis sensory transducer with Cache sensor n=1 Tax=Paludibacterium purpuratum TaxID=1144873 RepID=A0A4R7B5T5_9NEIS|nr:methyl-accepting chemotaxis protein [Paludibacterium purpuratum]TDR79961.1 methyl-accepting chemotaxis sensory transducer with Cache sensor [Paludibacterium purpuratum]